MSCSSVRALCVKRGARRQRRQRGPQPIALECHAQVVVLAVQLAQVRVGREAVKQRRQAHVTKYTATHI